MAAEALDRHQVTLYPQVRSAKSGGTVPVLCLISLAWSGTSARGMVSATFTVGLPSPVSLV